MVRSHCYDYSFFYFSFLAQNVVLSDKIDFHISRGKQKHGVNDLLMRLIFWRLWRRQ